VAPDHEPVHREEECQDAHRDDEPPLEIRVLEYVRRRYRDDPEDCVRDVLGVIQIEEAVHLAEQTREADQTQRQKNDAADEQELLGIQRTLLSASSTKQRSPAVHPAGLRG